MRSSHHFRPCLESLEDRSLPSSMATLTVTIPCSGPVTYQFSPTPGHIAPITAGAAQAILAAPQEGITILVAACPP